MGTIIKLNIIDKLEKEIDFRRWNVEGMKSMGYTSNYEIIKDINESIKELEKRLNILKKGLTIKK